MDAKANQAGVSVFLSSDRLASLSDTVFGVAMTLVVTTLLPSIQAHQGSVLTMFLIVGAHHRVPYLWGFAAEPRPAVRQNPDV